MARTTKCRKICSFPDFYSFVPEEEDAGIIPTVMMSLDEYETVRLLDYEGLNQEECALRMGVARTTVTAMYESARKKLVSAVVEGKRLRIAGGNIEIDRDRNGFSVDLKSKGDKTMRVAVTYDNGNVFGHFGRTEQFKVYDIEDGKVVNSQILGTNGEGCGALAGILSIADVDALICGGIGGGAVNAIEEAGIKLYAGASGSTDAAVEALIAGTLETIGEANCDHHDHEHGEGHSCRHGKCHE
ncbi:MAG: DUF134 domain-containing protein [Butyrivibrio sp.]|uniref:DUF134 domain-containing protein n=1 Tax=Butyrivibrio sp. TaxID=28121 RepID=UPI001B215FE3|nr:NifB/NifX family molybdenum-iron cluster-binding protein [Butyrivibrio sp.]MBO6240512.1 DUF134 domain-containing protein [Butyrivibrio sp.]